MSSACKKVMLRVPVEILIFVEIKAVSNASIVAEHTWPEIAQTRDSQEEQTRAILLLRLVSKEAAVGEEEVITAAVILIIITITILEEEVDLHLKCQTFHIGFTEELICLFQHSHHTTHSLMANTVDLIRV